MTTLFIQKLNKEKVGKFSFANRLNGNVPLLSDIWLDGNEKQMKLHPLRDCCCTCIWDKK